MGNVGEALEFAPFYQAWGRPAPQSWTDLGSAVIAAAKRQLGEF